MKKMTNADKSSKVDADVKTKDFVLDLLSDNESFLISPNIEAYALSEQEKAYAALLVQEAKESHFAKVLETLNGRLLQARHTIKALNEEVVRALSNGEPEDSLYVKELGYKIMVLIAQEAELDALVNLERKEAA